MMNMKIKEWIVPVTVLSIVVIISCGIWLTILNEQYQNAKDKTMDEIDGMNVSSDYRQGWIDALKWMDAWYHAPVNTTMNNESFITK